MFILSLPTHNRNMVCLSMYFTFLYVLPQSLSMLYMVPACFWNHTISLQVFLTKLLGRIGFDHIPHLRTDHHSQGKLAFYLGRPNETANEESQRGQKRGEYSSWRYTQSKSHDWVGLLWMALGLSPKRRDDR